MPAKNKHTNNIFNNQLLHLQADAVFGRFCEAQSLISGDYKEVLNLDAGYYMQAAGPRAAYRYAMPDNNVFVRHTGNKVYELTDHLGNVRATVSDACKAMYQNGSWKSTALVHNFNYYYPFGMPMPGLHGPANSTYRFGFNGQEKTDEIAGFGNHNTALFWEYDTRIARRWNLDPKPQISISDYAAFANNPILFSDPLGNVAENYITSDGTYLGFDENKGDGKIYVVTDKTIAKQIRTADKAQTSFSLANTGGNYFELPPYTERLAIKEIMNLQGKDPVYYESGGRALLSASSERVFIRAIDGEPIGPYESSASIDVNKAHADYKNLYNEFGINNPKYETDYTWHSHHDGRWVYFGEKWMKEQDYLKQSLNSNTFSNTAQTIPFDQQPSRQDIRNAKNKDCKRNFVVSRMKGQVYFYNGNTLETSSSSHSGSVKLDVFYNIKERVK